MSSKELNKMTQFDKIIEQAKKDFENKVDVEKLVAYLTFAKDNSSYKVFEHNAGYYVGVNGDKLSIDNHNYNEIIKPAIDECLVDNNFGKEEFADIINLNKAIDVDVPQHALAD